MQEELLQFIWQHRLLKPGTLRSSAGEAISIIQPGTINRGSGPDFFNGQISIGGVTLNGNIEIHVKASDWIRHRHQDDPAYDRLILHAVYENDCEVQQNVLFRVPVLELKNHISPEVLVQYAELCSAAESLPCHRSLPRVQDLTFSLWLERMGIERLEQRQEKIGRLLSECHGSYHEVLYRLLLANFGSNSNGVPFELIAKTLPLVILTRHADNLAQAEALLFGTAGLLDEQLEHKWPRLMQNEYEFLKRKYHLRSVSKDILKFGRVRPSNLPTLRLAHFAAAIHACPSLFAELAGCRSRAEIFRLLVRPLQGFWRHHYTLQGETQSQDLSMGEDAAENLIINTLAPFYFFYGKKFNRPGYCERALQLLEACRPENNAKTRLFSAKKNTVKTAMQSQGLLQLYDGYCARKNCLNCAVGAELVGRERGSIPKHTGLSQANEPEAHGRSHWQAGA